MQRFIIGTVFALVAMSFGQARAANVKEIVVFENSKTTDIYLHASLKLKERALARTKPHDVKRGRYRPPDRLRVFLANL